MCLRATHKRIEAADRDAVEKSLRHSALWDEVKDHLHKSAYELSGDSSSGCASRERWPLTEVLLLDEPCSALDPISTARSKSCCAVEGSLHACDRYA